MKAPEVVAGSVYVALEGAWTSAQSVAGMVAAWAVDSVAAEGVAKLAAAAAGTDIVVAVAGAVVGARGRSATA